MSRVDLLVRWNLVACAVSVTLGTLAGAAEIRLRTEARPEGSVVRLADVAEVFADDLQQGESLSAMDLCPAPAPGTRQFLRVREIQDALTRRGINLVVHRFSGASQVIVLGPKNSSKALPRRLSKSSVDQAEQAVADAVARFLAEQGIADESCKIDVALDENQTRLIAAAKSPLGCEGAPIASAGAQQFTISLETVQGPTSFVVTCQVTMPPGVVVATRAVSRGAIVRPADVQVQRIKSGSQRDDAFRTLDDVVGKEAVRGIAVGQVLDPQYVRKPLMVRKGEVVTLVARAEGLQVRTTARAREDGGQGDLINVELLRDRKSLLARVAREQVVEIYAAADTPPGGSK